MAVSVGGSWIVFFVLTAVLLPIAVYGAALGAVGWMAVRERMVPVWRKWTRFLEADGSTNISRFLLSKVGRVTLFVQTVVWRYCARVGAPWLGGIGRSPTTNSTTMGQESRLQEVDRRLKSASKRVSRAESMSRISHQNDQADLRRAENLVWLLVKELRDVTEEEWFARQKWKEAVSLLPLSSYNPPPAERELVARLEADAGRWAEEADSLGSKMAEFSERVHIARLRVEEAEAAVSRSKSIHAAKFEMLVAFGGLGLAPFIGIALLLVSASVCVTAKAIGGSWWTAISLLVAGWVILGISRQSKLIPTVLITVMIFSASVVYARLQVVSAVSVINPSEEVLASDEVPRVKRPGVPLVGFGLKEVCVIGGPSQAARDVKPPIAAVPTGHDGGGVRAILLGESNGAYALWTSGEHKQEGEEGEVGPPTIERWPVDSVRLISPSPQYCQ